MIRLFNFTLKGPLPMDPLTATMNALAAFNQFLVTPAGQKLATGAETLITDILGLFKVHLTPNEPPPAKPA